MSILPSPAALPQATVDLSGPMPKIYGLPGSVAYDIRMELTIANPRRAQHDRFAGGWTPYDGPSHFCGWDMDPFDSGWLAVAPGALGAVWRKLSELGIPCQLRWPEGRSLAPQFSFAYTGDAREEQRAVVDAVARRSSGIVVAPCGGGGKTDIGIQLVRERGLPTLILVHTRDLVDQWMDRFRERTDLVPSAFVGAAKKCDLDAPVVIATFQKLDAQPRAFRQLCESRLLVLVDEAHLAPAMTFTDKLRRLSCPVRYGLTATPQRDDGTTALMHWWIGPVVAEIPRDELEEKGRLLRPELRVLPTPFRSSYNPDEAGDANRLKQRLIACPERLAFVMERLMKQVAVGGFHLVLTDSVAYGTSILAGVRQAVPEAEFLHGKLGKKMRRAILADARKGALRVLVATTLADVGLDVPCLDTVWLVSPLAAAGRTEQRWGRICRPREGKVTPRIFDFVDVLVARTDMSGNVHRIYVNQFRRRSKAYKGKVDADWPRIADALRTRI